MSIMDENHKKLWPTLQMLKKGFIIQVIDQTDRKPEAAVS